MRKSEYRLGDHPQQFIKEVKINNKTVILPAESNNFCIYDDKLIVKIYRIDLENLYPKENPGRNIWCYRDDGTLLWKIEESPKFFTWPEEYIKENPDEKDYYDAVIYLSLIHI